jgi:MYXO-CTERM domain-containing protein
MILRFRSAVFAWGALSALATVPLTEQPARACGGCFRPQQVVSAVNAHRMVFSVSPTQSILWDQFSYSGDPQDFAWVLPVHAANVKVELAHDEFISALDAWTSPIIRGPQNSGGGGFGCGASNAAVGAPTDNVQVINQEVVGPYEVATLRSTDPTALDNWLTQHGYDIPPSIQPTIAAYVSEGFDFIALRLQPGQGVASMQPVRVVTQGADPTLPLRMVAAGIGSDVGILLFVISEGRYEAANFNNDEVDFSKLQWNPNLSESNYNDLIQQAMTSGDGRNFTVEFAGHLDGRDSINGAFENTYYSGVTSSKTCPYTNIHGTDFGTDAGTPTFTDGGGDDASADAAGDASTDGGAVSDGGTSSDGGTLAEPYDPCSYDDLTAATAGMNPSDVFVTRLRADLPASALSQDLTLHAAADQSPYSNVHDATQTGDGCSASGGAQDRGVVVMALGALAALAVSRRRKRA